MLFKNLESDDVLISPFEVHKTFTVTNVDSGSGVYALPIIKGTDATQYDWTTDSASKTISSSIFYSLPNYYVINTMYYRDITDMHGRIDWINGTPKGVNPVITYTQTRNLYDTVANKSQMSLRRPYTRQLHQSASVISIPQELYGESISVKSVRLTDDSSDSTIILQDDGVGNLYDITFSSSYASKTPNSVGSGSVVGNIFYDDGLIVITDTGSYSNVGLGEASDGFSLTFDSTQTIYEHEYVCRIGENEFQHTNNRSLKVGQSGSVQFFGNKNVGGENVYKNTLLDRYPYDLTGYSTSSFKNEEYKIGTKLIGAATHSDFGTYVTSIGLYNDNNELVAMGKTAKPIKNDKEMALTFVVRFDTN
jgi:hypothetical protein|tara:strand:- start:218 stop:1309 length:1092 start_codon:yes stop_codon:yes gene_type:complete